MGWIPRWDGLWIAFHKFTVFSSCLVLRCVNGPHFLHPLLSEGEMDSFQLLALINKAVINIVEHVTLLHVRRSSWYLPRSSIAGSSGSILSNFLKEFPKWFPECLYWLANPSSNGGVFLFLHILVTICCHLSFDLSHSYRFCWNLRNVLICISFMTKYFEHFFRCLLAIQCYLRWEFFVWLCASFLIGLHCSLDSKFLNSLYILDIRPLSDVGLVKIFIICWLPFCMIDSRWWRSTILQAGAGG